MARATPWTLRFPLTKRRAFKRELGSTLRFRLSLPLLTSSTSTSAGPGCTSPPGMSAAPKPSVAAHAETRSALLDGLAAQAITQEPYRRPAVRFGSWIIDLSTAARVRPTMARIKCTSDFSVVQRKVTHAQRFPLAQWKEVLLASFMAGFPRRSGRYAPSISGLESGAKPAPTAAGSARNSIPPCDD